MPNFNYCAALLATLIVAGCSKSPESPLVEANQSPTFVGSTACQDCHQAEFNDWTASHHEQAMQVADAKTVLGDFDDVSLDYYGATVRFFQDDGAYFVTTADATGEERDFRIAYTFGVEPLQQYLIKFPDGRLQTLAFSWDTRPVADGGQRWFHIYPDENIAYDDDLHWTGLQQNWNYMCAECHSTNVDMGFDSASNTFDTTYSEISVGCEACHGPGSTHVDLAIAGNAHDANGFNVDLDDRGDSSWVMNVETGIAELNALTGKRQQQVEACGRCHSRRGIIAPEYEFGQPLAHTHMPATLDEDLYFADGQILDEVFVYGSFLQSKMYQAGVTCTDCHNPHSAELKTGTNANDVCSQCHLPTKFAVAEHAAHAPDQAGCVDCHMTDRTYMVVDDRRDHSFRIPRPDLSDTVGSPNACTTCHADQDSSWAATAVNSWRTPDTLPARHFATAFAAAREGFANAELLNIIGDQGFPGIVRASAVSRLSQPFGSNEYRTLESALGSSDALIKIAALRQLHPLPDELRLRLPGAKLLNDSVRGVRIEAVSAYAGLSDLLPIEEARGWARAESELRETYLSLANRPEALSALATFETAEGNIRNAVDLYEQALRIEPRASAARTNLADLLRQTGQEGRAEDVLRAGLVLDTSNAALHHALGLSLVRSGAPEAALGELRQAAELAPDNPRFHYVLGIALNSMGQQQEAIQILRAARNRFEGDFDIAIALATILRDSGEQDEALETAYTLAKRHPEDQRVLALLRSLGAVP